VNVELLPSGWDVSDEHRADRGLIGIHIPGRDEMGYPETTCHLIDVDKAVALANRILEIATVIKEVEA
jgi:hypothetical protein